MEPTQEAHPGLLQTLKRLGRVGLRIAENRAELLLVELEEERCRALRALLWVMCAAVLALMTLSAGTLAVVLACPPEHRLTVLAGLSVVYLGGTLAAVWRLRADLRQWRSFSASIAELKKDKACWEET